MLNAAEPLLRLPNLDAEEVDRRLDEGWTLPAQLYTDPAIAELEDQLVWRPAWHVVGTVLDFKNVGDYLTAHVGGKYPVIVVKSPGGELKAFRGVIAFSPCAWAVGLAPAWAAPLTAAGLWASLSRASWSRRAASSPGWRACR